MNIRIAPGEAQGRIKAPPSKSMAHRALICAALSPESTVKGIELSEDIKATLSCLGRLGAKTELSGSTVTAGGLEPQKIPADVLLDCSESGSTLRFLLPLCLLSSSRASLTGHGRLMQRPLEVYSRLCTEQGLLFRESNGCVTVCGPLRPGEFKINGGISSQFISGLMLALPLLERESSVIIEGAAESSSYIRLTLKSLGDFGVRITRLDERTYKIPGGQRPRSRTLRVEGDYSNAAFLEAFNLLGGSVLVENLAEDSLQGDRVYKKMFKALSLGFAELELSDCPDLAPVLFSLAAAKKGALFTGTARLRLKESDRAAAMQEELSKFGIKLEISDNSVIVSSGALHRPSEPLSSHNDHRIAMALAVLCSKTGGIITGAQAVSKSYPSFWRDVAALGIPLEEIQ